MAFSFDKKSSKGPQAPPSLEVEIAPKKKAASPFPGKKSAPKEEEHDSDSSSASFSCPGCGCKLGVKCEDDYSEQDGSDDYSFGGDEE